MRFLDHTQRHHTQWESSGRVIGPFQKRLRDKTKHSVEHPYPPRDSNPQSQQALDRADTGIGHFKTVVNCFQNQAYLSFNVSK
jgi:hypothetical protein